MFYSQLYALNSIIVTMRKLSLFLYILLCWVLGIFDVSSIFEIEPIIGENQFLAWTNLNLVNQFTHAILKEILDENKTK